ncbi:helicase-exonuclease AddAB subunit AddA [Streptococcus didelphis]|uniref:helicase-exonuclease AddAB subunit AddA n=1 Tax=Streptococcus didelphis TaxID=102886 RepID=UPI0003650A38|nr:helicase-exonuclease AddAB subunit AddA [Streptococcus didelphis]
MQFPKFLSDAEIHEKQVSEKVSDSLQKRTAEQIEAIYTNGHNVLVSASAGSGKTFVMVERIVDKILRGISLKQMFISTFTVKAANELKERIEKKLIQELKEAKDNDLKAYLSREIQELSQADIGTMDSFTQKLLNDYGYTIGISPKFRILQDKSEQDILKNEVYQKLFTDYMESEQTEKFIALVKNFSGNRKDSRAFRDLVYKIYYFSQATENPKQWLQDNFLKGAKQYKSFADLPQDYIKQLLLSMQETADKLRGLTELEDYGQLTKAGKPTAKYSKHLVIIEKLNDWSNHFEHYYGKEKITQLAQEISLLLPSGNQVTVAGKKYPIYKDLQEKITVLRHLDTVFNYQGEAIPLLELLQDFLLDFSDTYLALKIEENAFEFSDIGHFAITILRENPAIQKAYQKKYHEVMVDEYQDNNHTQECLLELLSNGHNRFMVGDIKQSIYRFRQADPGIFNAKFKDYQENPDHGKLILLKENFRSQSEVIDATNAVFSHLMDEEVGDLVYNTNHHLLAGSQEQKLPHPENKCQVLLYDTGATADDKEVESEQEIPNSSSDIWPGEVKIVAKEIIRLYNEEKVSFSDITLLVSSRSRNDSIFHTFSQYGIPLVADGGRENYLKSVEVLVMLDTLRSIDNPLNDYALVALLKSPMFSFDEDQLARIALQESQDQKSLSFYEKMLASLSEESSYAYLITADLKQEIQVFMTVFKAWRDYAKIHSLYDLIWKIFNERFYFDYVGTLPKAEQAQANLYALALRARQFEKSGFKGLSRFVAMIDKILDTDNDLADVDIAKPKEAVNLMTIHKSKGLEFKYVFILNCDKKFSMEDLHAQVILSRTNGIGIKYLADLKKELDTNQFASLKLYLETLSYQLNKNELKRATLSEQMRLFYVAMTRAEKKIYLIGKGNPDKQSDKYDAQNRGNRLSLEQRLSLQSFQDWILAIYENFNQENLNFTIHYRDDSELTNEEIGYIQAKAKLDTSDIANNRQSDSISHALDMLEKVAKINQTYEAAINLPTVRTPSQLKKIYEPFMDLEGVDIIEKAAAKPQAFSLPDFSKEKKVKASQIGSSLHELMQRIPISEKVSLEDIEEALKRVTADKNIKDYLDKSKILAFFEKTSLGQLIQQNRDKLHREAPFAILKEDKASHEKFVIRGIIDGFLLFDDRIVLFDYKTDNYRQASELKMRYEKQLELYAEALKQAYNKPIVDKYLVLMGGEEVELIKI